MISQLFILSPRGDVIINKQFRLDVPVKITTEVFFRTVKFWTDGDKAPAVFNEDGVNYVHVKVAGLFVAATTRKNVSPSLVLELLHRVAKVIKDYCGVLSEDALRKNSILAYELIDELLDHGYAQTTDTETLKQRVFNEPVHAHEDPGKAGSSGTTPTKKYGFFSASMGAFNSSSGVNGGNAKRSAVNRSVIEKPKGPAEGTGGRNEIFVDVVEKLNVTFNAQGAQVSSEIDGSIQVRNFLHDNAVKIKLALNEELSHRRPGPRRVRRQRRRVPRVQRRGRHGGAAGRLQLPRVRGLGDVRRRSDDFDDAARGGVRVDELPRRG